MTDNASFDAWYSAVVGSHRRIAELVSPLTDDELVGPSYADEWTIADVLSHLGSGAEIFSLILDAGRDGNPAPGLEDFQPIWDRWNAKPASEQAHDAILADRAFLDRIDALDEQQRAGWAMAMFGGDQTLTDLLRFRLGEHALHTWDVAVMRTPDATVASDAVDLLVDNLGMVAGRSGKPTDPPLSVLVVTDEPTRRFVVQSASEGVSLTGSDDNDGADATLQLPAEALVRLVYGRLDPRHTPAVTADGVDLDVLRRVFPGF